MKIMRKHSGFTLVEVLVAMTIFAMTMVSVMIIYASASQIALKTDINREMQQNIKSVVETIAEDVRKHGIMGASKDSTDPYKMELSPNSYYTGSRLQTGTGSLGKMIEYRLYGFGPSTTGDSVGNGESMANSQCQDIKNTCYINVGHGGTDIGPLSNSKISFTNLEFYVTNGKIPKVTINFTARPAAKNGLRPDLIKNAELHFQTTISERHLQVQ